MYLDTHSQKTMERSVCAYLGISTSDLYTFLEEAGMASQKEYYFNGYTFNSIIDKFLAENTSQFEVDEILFFHLGRRLNATADDTEGRNLADLLTTSNPFSDYLKAHEFDFKRTETHIDVLYKGRPMLLDDRCDPRMSYLRSRLGYNEGREDYCFNGFAFKDILYRNQYVRILFYVPEIIAALSNFVNDIKIRRDYIDASKFFCFEYLVPFDKIVFDQDENMSELQKRRYFVKQILQRLYEYRTCELQYMSDEENPILRLADEESMPTEFFVSKEEIFVDMVGK